MAVRKKEKPLKEQNAAMPDFSAELREQLWSVISFDKYEAKDLTYAEAERKMSELEAEKVSGLCIVTNEVAARIKKHE